MKNLVYSFNEENWYEWDDMDAIIQEERFIPFVYTGEKIILKHKDFIDLSYLTESMEDLAYECVSEYSEGYLEDLTYIQAKELEEMLISWFDNNIKQPNFFKVENVREIGLEEFYNKEEMLDEII